MSLRGSVLALALTLGWHGLAHAQTAEAPLRVQMFFASTSTEFNGGGTSDGHDTSAGATRFTTKDLLRPARAANPGAKVQLVVRRSVADESGSLANDQVVILVNGVPLPGPGPFAAVPLLGAIEPVQAQERSSARGRVTLQRASLTPLTLTISLPFITDPAVVNGVSARLMKARSRSIGEPLLFQKREEEIVGSSSPTTIGPSVFGGEFKAGREKLLVP